MTVYAVRRPDAAGWTLDRLQNGLLTTTYFAGSYAVRPPWRQTLPPIPGRFPARRVAGPGTVAGLPVAVFVYSNPDYGLLERLGAVEEGFA